MVRENEIQNAWDVDTSCHVTCSYDTLKEGEQNAGWDENERERGGVVLTWAALQMYMIFHKRLNIQIAYICFGHTINIVLAIFIGK